MKTNLSLKDELLSAIRRIVAKFWAQEVGQLMRLQSVGYHAKLRTKIGIRSRIGSRMLLSTLLMLTICIGNAWGETVSVSINTYASANSWTSGTAYSSVAIDANVSATGLTNGNNSKYYSSNSSWRHYEGDGGTITIATTSGTLSSITFTYANGNSGVIKYDSANKTSGIAISVSGSSASFTVGHSSGTKNGNVQITAISVTYTPSGGGSTPSLTADPTSLAWGTVLQGSSQSDKTISISGSNLTAGSLTIAASGGYSVTPTSKSVSGTLSATTLTVTPPSTATTGAKNGKITISGGGLASDVEVDLTMTVNAAYTVNWYVGGTQVKTELVASGATATLPPTPADNALGGSCSSLKFVGWSETNIGSIPTTAPADLFTAAPTISAAKDYYAVFAESTIAFEDDMNISGPSGVDSRSGWSSFSKANGGDGSIRLSTGSYAGVMTTNALSSLTSSATQISFEIAAWSGSENGKVTLSASKGTIATTAFTATSTSFTAVSTTITGADATTQLTFTGASGYRIYIRNIVVGSASNYVTSCCSLKPVTSLAVTSTTGTSVTLGWTAPSPTTGIDHLELRNASTDVKIGSNIAVGTTSVTVSDLTECATYSYKIVSVGSCEVASSTINAQPYSGAKTVTYNYHEGTGSPASFTTDCSHTSTTLPTPTRANYRFDGWYTSANGGTRKGGGGDSYTPDATIELHAQWTRVYTVSYAYAGGSGSCAGGSYAEGETVTTCATATKAGSTLTGWTRSDNSATVTPGNTFTMPASNVTLTTVWADTPYTLTQNVGSHTTKGHSTATIKSGDLTSGGLDMTYTISDNSFALPKAVTISGGGQTWTLGTNYTWELSADKHSATLHIGSNLTISANVTITVTEKARYTVVWDEHGSTTTEYYTADDNNVTLKGGIADCGEKKFYGWTEDSEFTTHATTPPTMASSGTISENKHYYAIFADAVEPVNPGYVKVTSISAGTYLIATTSQAYTGKVDGQTYGGHVAVSVSDGVISSKPNDAVEVTVTLGTGVNASKFDIYDGTHHLQYKDKGITFGNSQSIEWQLTAEGYIQNTDQTSYTIQYNSGSPRFACYSSAQTKAYLYKKQTTSYSNFAKTCALYDITITTPSGGTVTTSPAAGTGAAGEGQTVTVNVTPNSCKYLSALKYNDGSDHAISIASAPYTFTMPASDVTVTATFADKSVSSIAANTSTHRTLMQNTSFVGEQIRVTFNSGETEDLAYGDSKLAYTGYNMSTLGSQTVTVTYTGCGTTTTTYSITITDGIPVTFSDCGNTTLHKYDPGDVVPVETIDGEYPCVGWQFVGWSSSSVADNSTSFTPVTNFTASEARTLYAVYADTTDVWLSALDATEMRSGATYVIIGEYGGNEKNYALTTLDTLTNYLRRHYLSTPCEKVREPGTYKDRFKMKVNVPPSLKWFIYKDGDYWKIKNKGNNKYLKITTTALSMTNTAEDEFTFGDNDNDESKVSIQSHNSNYYLSYYNSGKYWNAHTSGYSYFCTNMRSFTSNPPCAKRSVTFHGNGGTVTAYGSGSSGGTLVVTEATRDAGIKLPTAAFSDCSGKSWTFMGWVSEERALSRVPILTTELLEDGVANADHTILSDDEVYYAVYSSTGTPETKYGVAEFVQSDSPNTYGDGTINKTIGGNNYAFPYTQLGHASSMGIQFKESTGMLKNSSSLGKINYISFKGIRAGSISNLHVYVGATEDAVTTELTGAGVYKVAGDSMTFYPNDNYPYFKITATAYTAVEHINVGFGLGAKIYGTTPDCSTISLSGDVYVTSRSGIGIMAVTPLSVEAHQLAADADVVITSNSSDVYFSTDRTPNFSKASKPTASVTVRANPYGELTATPIYVHYKPSSTGTGAASDVTVYANLSPANPNIKGEHTIHVRNLPEKVVIAAKVGGAYYALPADMNAAATNPAGVLIDVNEDDMTATAPKNCSYTIWPVKTTSGSEDRYALHEGNAYGERVRFSAPNNTTVNAGLWANNSTSSGDDTKINNNAAIASISADPAEAYEWKITTTVTDGKWSHTLQTDQSTNKNYLRYWTAASGGPKWGTYASGEQILYLLPVTEVTPFEMEVVEWYPTKVLVNTTSDLTGNTLTVRVNGAVDGDAAVTGKGSNLYEISNLDLAGNPTKSLRVDYGTSPINSCTKAIPVIISRSTQNVTAAPFTTLTKEVYSKADLVVRDNAVLTLDGTIAENTFSSVTIYPTAKISVPSDKKLTANSLTFFGGIDDIYNGSTYTVNKYGVPELSLKGRVGKALSTINYDMRVDLSQMYALALPYDVNIAAITYWDGTAMTPGTNLYISAYDGQARVNRESSTWIYEEDFEEKLGAATLKAGVGYTISAELQSGFGNEYSIIRMPMQAGLTADATEVAKTVAVVAYVNNQGATVTENHKGWNFVGNPYMASISGGEPDSKLIVGKLVPNNAVEPWDGSYMWDGTTYPYRYVTIPSDDGTENWQSKWTEVTLKPFKNFFIQVGTSGDLSFALASRVDAPARYMQAQEHEVEFELLLSSEMSHDHTGLLLADKYTPAYEINADLEKMENPMSVYTLTGGYKLAYNALSPNDAKQPIPVGYIANEAGTYTFQLDERSDVNEVEHIWLTDYELDRVTDLTEAAYDFTTIVGRNETRFALTVELRSGEEIATDIGNSIDGIVNDGAVKFIWHDKMYILNQGVIYDSTGKRVREINK